MSKAPTERFSNRVDYYVRYRPRYPRATIDFLRSELDFTQESIVTDVDCGTGLLKASTTRPAQTFTHPPR